MSTDHWQPPLDLTCNAPIVPIARDGDDQLHRGIWPCSIPLWMAAFWIALFIIRPWEILFPGLADYHVARLYALAMMAVVAALGRPRICGLFQSSSVLLLLAALSVSTAFALDRSAAWNELYAFMTLVVFYFILLSVIRTPYQLLFIVTCYVAIMAAYLVKSQYEYFVHGHYQYDMGVRRLVGIETSYGAPNALAASTVLSLPFLHLLWRLRHRFTWTWPAFWRRWFPACLLLYFVLALSSIVLTNSRSGMLGFVVFVLLSALRGKSFRQKAPAAGWVCLLLAAVWLLMPTENQGRLQTVWDPSAGPRSAQHSAMGRVEGLRQGLKMFSDYPLVGAGVSSFIRYRTTVGDGVALNAHSLVGQVLGETGILGSAAFVLVLAGVFINCRRTRAIAENRPHADRQVLCGIATACGLSVVLLLFFGLFGHNMLRFNWLWVAAFAVLCRGFAAAADGNHDVYGRPRSMAIGGTP